MRTRIISSLFEYTAVSESVRGVIRILGTFTFTSRRLCYPDPLKLYYKCVLSFELVQSSFPIKISILFMPLWPAPKKRNWQCHHPTLGGSASIPRLRGRNVQRQIIIRIPPEEVT